MNDLFSSQRAKKNWINAGIIALVIAIVIMLNAIVSVLGDKFSWYVDMTDEEIYTISDALKETLNGANSAVDVEIIFTCSEDFAKSNYSNLSSGEALAYVHSTATQIANEYSNIHISYHDIEKERSFFETKFADIDRFLTSLENPVIMARRTVDENGETTYGTHFKVYAARSFYGFSSSDSSLYAYNGEKVFAAAILSLTLDDAPTVYFTSTHNEKLSNKTSDGTDAPVELMNLFFYCGFKVEMIDLTQEIPSDARMIVINQPEFDLTALEVGALEAYTANKGSLMIFANPDNLKNLQEMTTFMETRCGVTTNTDDKVTDNKSSIIGDKLSLRGEFTNSVAAKTYLSYLANSTAAKPFFTNSASIKIKDAYTTEDGVYEGDSYTYTQPLYQTASSGEYMDISGNHLLMSVTSIIKGKDGGEPFSYVVYCPSEGFASDEALQNQAYPNQDIVLSLVHSMTSAQTTVNIDYKAFVNYDLDITERQAKTVTVVLSVILPICVVAVGAVLLIRRKRR